MQEINVKELVAHPRNTDFFDDMSGQKWDEFLESVKIRLENGKSGIIERIIITTEMTIVSGHQRVRACKELGIEKIKCEIRKYDDEDELLRDLIETNIRQRGDISSSSLKMGRIIRELERLYGVKHGGDKSKTTNGRVGTQEQIADMLGMTTKDIQRYKKLTTLIPELQDLIDDKISASTASRVIAKLSPAEQEELISSLDITKKYTQKQIQEYIDKLAEKDSTIITLQSRKPEQIETIIDNTDYKTLKNKEEELKLLNNKYLISQEKERLLKERVVLFENDSENYKKLKTEIEDMTKSKDSIGRQIDAITSIAGFASNISTFLKTELSPIKYSKALLEMKSEKTVTNNLSDIVYEVQKWCDEMRTYLPETDKMNVIDMEEN